ncbi:MAG TPA: HEAT repeat domain-containing protein [Polyangiaceae bacterium]|jgi:HEAT repeat protein
MNTSTPALGLSPNDRERMEEVQRLAQTGPAGVDALVGLLSETSWAVRRAVVATLARLGASAIARLCRVLEEERTDETRLAAAVDALVASGSDVEPKVMAMAEATSKPAVLCDAAQIFGRRKSHGAVAALSRWVHHADDNVAVAAVEALGRIGGPEVLEPLLAAARSGNFFRAFPAVAFLGQSGDRRVVETLRELLSEPYYVTEAAMALGRSGHLAAVEPLARLLSHPSDVVVRTAAQALLDLRRHHAERFGHSDAVLTAFRQALEPNAPVRAAASLANASSADRVALACALGWMRDATAADTLLSMLDGDPTAAGEAFEALRVLGSEVDESIRRAIAKGDSQCRARLLPLLGARRSALAEMLVCLRDPDPAVRALACDALGRCGETSAVRPLFEVIGDADARVSQAAVGAIQSLGSDETRGAAIHAARAGDPRTRRAALRVVSYFAYPEALDALLEAVVDPDERIREVATAGLALLEDPRAFEALRVALAHTSASTRAAACRALGSGASTEPVRTALLRALSDDDAWVRYYACQSIGKLRILDAMPEIVKLLDDRAGQVRVAAVEAIARLGGTRSLEILERATQGDDSDVRSAALLGLAHLRRPEALHVLLTAAESSDPALRLIALAAIAEVASSEADDALMRAGFDADDNVRAAAIAHLATRGPAATAWLVDRLLHGDEQDAILDALAKPADGRIEGILGALATANAYAARLLIEALVRMRRPSGSAAIEAALNMENVHARRAAAAVLVNVGSASARAALALAASADDDDEVRRIAAA